MSMHSRISDRDMEKLSRCLSTAYVAGTTVSDAVSLFTKHSTNNKLINALSAVTAECKTWTDLSSAADKRQRLLGPFFCSIVNNGESSGQLGLYLWRAAEYYKRKDEFQKTLLGILRHQAPYIFSASAILFSILLFFIPALFHNSFNTPNRFLLIILIAIGASGFIVFICFLTQVYHLNSTVFKIPFLSGFFRFWFLHQYFLELSVFSTDKAPSLPEASGCLPPLIAEMLKNEQHSNADSVSNYYAFRIEAAFKGSLLMAGPVFLAVTGFLGIGLLLTFQSP